MQPASKSTSSSADYQFDTSIFNGFRVLFNFIVVYGHVMFFTSIMLDSPELPIILNAENEPLASAFSLPVLFMSLYAVDVFLFISGYLFGRSLFSTQSAENSHLPYTWRHGVTHIINRVLRLFPVLAIACTIGALRGAKACMTHNVIYELLHISNCNPLYRHAESLTIVCVIVAWSLTTDVQAHVFMASSIVILKSHKRVARFLCFAVVFQMLCRANFIVQLGRPLLVVRTVKNLVLSVEELAGFASLLNLPMGNISIDEELKEYNRKLLTDSKVFSSPYMRTAPAFVGFLTWYAVQQRNSYVRFIEKNVIISLLTVLSITATFFLSSFFIPSLNGSPAWLCILHESVHRVIFSCAVSGFVVILGSPITAAKSRLVRGIRKIYSNQIVNRIADLSYAIYLLHMYFLRVAHVVPPRITPEQFEMWRFVASGVQVYLMTLAVAVPVHRFEKQFHVIRKRITRRGVMQSVTPRSEKSGSKEE